MAPSFLHWFFCPLSIFHITLIICCLGHVALLWGLTGGAVVWWAWRGGADKGGGQCAGGGCSLGLLPGQGRLLNREGRKVTVDEKVWLTDTDIKPRKMCTDIQWEWNGLWRAKCSSHTHTCVRVHTHNIYTLSNSTSALGHCLSPENRAGGSGGGWGVWGGGIGGWGGGRVDPTLYHYHIPTAMPEQKSKKNFQTCFDSCSIDREALTCDLGVCVRRSEWKHPACRKLVGVRPLAASHSFSFSLWQSLHWKPVQCDAQQGHQACLLSWMLIVRETGKVYFMIMF